MTATATTALTDAPVEIGEHSLILDGDDFRRYVEYEVTRLKAKAVDAGRPLGLRLSTHCPIRRVKEFYDPTRYRLPIHEGVAERGHEMESRFYACMSGLVESVQATIQWELGTSAFDALGVDGVPIELKSSIKARTPSSANRAQADRMLTVTDRTELVFYMLDPGSLTARGPFAHTLTPGVRDSVKAELDGCQRALDALAKLDRPTGSAKWDDRAWWLDVFGLTCSCGACLTHEATDADVATEDFATAYHLAKTSADASKAALDAARDALVEAARARLQAKGETAGRVRTYWTAYTVSISAKTGRATIRKAND